MKHDVRLREWGSRAVPIDDETKEQWVQQCIEKLETNPGLDQTHIWSGDSMILVRRLITDGYEVMDLYGKRHAFYYPKR